MLKCQWLLHGGLIRSISYQRTTYKWKQNTILCTTVFLTLLFNLEINHLKTASASISFKVSWISLLLLLVSVPCRWQMTMDYWLNYTDKRNPSSRRKICRSTTLPTTKPATNVIKMNLSNRLVLLRRRFLQIPGEVPQTRPDRFLPHSTEVVTNLIPNIHWGALQYLPGKNLYFTCGSVPI